MIRKRQGAIIVMTVFFLMAALIVVGFLIDVTRIQLAKHQIRMIADSTALAVVNNFQIATYSFDHTGKYRQIHFIRRSPSECWISNPYESGSYVPNSMFLNRHGNRFEDATNNSEHCLTVDQIADVYARLNISTRPFEKAGFSGTPGYQFDPDTMKVVSVIATNQDEGGPEVEVVVEANVGMIFGNIVGMRSVRVQERSKTTVQFLTGGS